MKQFYHILKGVMLIPLLLIQLNVLAQSGEAKRFTGTIKDNKGRPISGVAVSVQENEVATTVLTDAEGKFTISVSEEEALVLKKAGYLTNIYTPGRSEGFSVVLEEALINAGDDDNIQIPFGERKKRYLTAAASSLKAEDLPQPLTSQLTSLFAGRLAGLNVLQSNTQPGNDFSSFRVRGESSFSSSNPLVIVDGTEREFSDLDLNEIESVTVLKDAASLAWYGLRGSNGVVLVTTVKGNPSKSILRFDSQYGFQNPDKVFQPLNSYDYVSLYTEAENNDRQGLASSITPTYPQSVIDAYRSGSDPYLFPDNNYVSRFITNSSPFIRNVLTASGGSSTVRYYTLLGFLNQQGIFNHSDTGNPSYNSNNGYKRFNFRGNIDFDVNNTLTLNLNLGGRVENRISSGNGTQGILNSIYSTAPNAYPILNSDMTLGGNANYRSNILGDIRNSGMNRSIQRVGLANVSAVQKLDKLITGLSASALISYDVRGRVGQGFSEDYQVFDLSSGKPVAYRNFANVEYDNDNFAGQVRTNEIWAGLDYVKQSGDHSWNSTLRFMRNETVAIPSFQQRIQGLSGRVDYKFKNRYLLGFTGSYSGDDDLPEGERYGFFPAASAGWIISDENFLQNNNVLSFAKVRGSYGVVGNSSLDFFRRFPYKTYYDRNIGGGGYTFGTSFSPSPFSTELNIGNPFITYEKIYMSNIGLDFNLFNNSLSGSFDVFNNKRTNILTSPAISAVLGQNTGDVNEGEVNSNGVEGSLVYRKAIGSLNLSFNANLLITDNEIINQNGQTGIPSYQNSIGTSSNSGLYYLSDGLYQSDAEIKAGPASLLAGGRDRTFPGDIRYQDVNGDNIIDALDRVRLDFGTPKYFGFGTVLRLKSFDFNAQFQGVTNRKIDVQSIVEAGPDKLNQQSMKRWTSATATSAEYPRLSLTNRGNNTAISDFWMRDANYLKLKTVELGYSLPTSLASRIKTQGLRIYVSAFNPLTFSNLDLDVDPELPFLGQQGGTYPYLKTYSFGLTAKF